MTIPAPPRARLRAVSLALVLGLSAGTASGDAGPRIDNGLYVMPGPILAAAFHPVQSNGMVFGAEVSVPYFRDGLWAGAYGDVVRDFGASTTRFTFGPELGLGPLGVDGGYLFQIAEHGTRHGYALRGLLTLGIVGLYTRYGHLSGGDPGDESHFTEVGVLIKAFFPAATDERRRYRGRPVEPPPPEPPPAGSAEPPPAGSAEPPRFAEPPP